MMTQKRFLVLDTETGGLDPARHSILSLAGVVWQEGSIAGSVELYINEGASLCVDADALHINRIDVHQLRARGQSPATVIEVLHEFLDRYFGPPASREKIDLVGHNVSFDVAFMRRLYSHAGADFDSIYSHRALDTAAIVRFLCLAEALPLTEAGSTAVFDYFKIAPQETERHTAKADALATAQLLNHLIGAVRPKPR